MNHPDLFKVTNEINALQTAKTNLETEIERLTKERSSLELDLIKIGEEASKTNQLISGLKKEEAELLHELKNLVQKIKLAEESLKEKLSQSEENLLGIQHQAESIQKNIDDQAKVIEIQKEEIDTLNKVLNDRDQAQNEREEELKALAKTTEDRVSYLKEEEQRLKNIEKGSLSATEQAEKSKQELNKRLFVCEEGERTYREQKLLLEQIKKEYKALNQEMDTKKANQNKAWEEYSVQWGELQDKIKQLKSLKTILFKIVALHWVKEELLPEDQNTIRIIEEQWSKNG